RVGTPSYMAPEQLAGGEVTAKADQYSFCVSLWEGLHGARPGAEVREGIPGWVTAAVSRGLRPDPDARWPSMDDLLAALARDPAARRRRILLAGGAAALAAVAAWGLLRAPAPVGDPCAAGPARLAGVWDAPRKDAVRAAFAATGLPYSDDAWRGASARVDDYAARWVGVHREACRATRVEGRQSDTLMDLRMACLH